MTRYWVMAPYESTLPEIFEQVWQFDLENGVISIGWCELGDISDSDKREIKTAYEKSNKAANPGVVTRTANMLWNFYHEIEPGDIIIARKGTKRIAAVGTVTGRAYYSQTKNTELRNANPTNFHCNFIDVRWHRSPRDVEFDRIVFGIQTLYEIGEPEYKKLVKDENDEPIEEGVTDRKQFFLEKYLEEFIVSNFDAIFKGVLVLFRDLQEDVIGQQYRTDVGIIDILAVEPSTNSFVVIELKKGRESDVVVGQILRYMGWIRENLCKDGQDVRGMIICHDADDRLYYALKATQNIEVKYYRIGFELVDSPA